MAPRVVTFLVILAANIAVGGFWFFFLLLALNGSHSADARWGIYFFIFAALAVSVAAGLLGAALVHFLIRRRRLSPLASTLISVPIFVIAGGGLNFLGIIVGAVIVEIVRTNF